MPRKSKQNRSIKKIRKTYKKRKGGAASGPGNGGGGGRATYPEVLRFFQNTRDRLRGDGFVIPNLEERHNRLAELYQTFLLHIDRGDMSRANTSLKNFLKEQRIVDEYIIRSMHNPQARRRYYEYESSQARRFFQSLESMQKHIESEVIRNHILPLSHYCPTCF